VPRSNPGYRLRSLRDRKEKKGWRSFYHPRGYRSYLSQPPATICDPSGIVKNRHFRRVTGSIRISSDEPGGFAEFSRWLRSEATTPPERKKPRRKYSLPFPGVSLVPRSTPGYRLQSLRDRKEKKGWRSFDHSGCIARTFLNPRLPSAIPPGLEKPAFSPGVCFHPDNLLRTRRVRRI